MSWNSRRTLITTRCLSRPITLSAFASTLELNAVLSLGFFSFSESTLLFPVGVAALSILVLSGQLVWRLHVGAQKSRTRAEQSDLASPECPGTTCTEDGHEFVAAKHVGQHGERTIFAYNLVRAAASVALLGVSIYSAIDALGRPRTLEGQAVKLIIHIGTCVAYVSEPRICMLHALAAVNTDY